MFNFGNRLMQIALYLTDVLLFIASYIMLKKVLNFTIVDRRQKNLLRSKKLVVAIAIDYAILTGLLVWGLYTQGFYDIWALLNYVLQNLSYLISECLIFAMVVNINLKFRLQTQVH